MSVGPIQSHESVLCGHLTLTLTDAEGNILSVRRHSNIVNTYGKKILASCAFNGGAGVSAIYIYVMSGFTATPTLSMVAMLSNSAAAFNAGCSINNTNQPLTATWSFHNDTQWSVNGTMTFVGYGGYSSVDGAAICFGSFATASASYNDRPGGSWFAQACFTDLAINSVDKLSFNWAFSLSTTTSTAV